MPADIDDEHSYRIYTGPQEIHKALNGLKGIIEGAVIDGVVTAGELGHIRDWMDEHRKHAGNARLSETYGLLQEAMADGQLDEEEISDLLWQCRQASESIGYYKGATEAIQQLSGMLGAIAADQTITKEELLGLQGWIGENEHLKGTWPYDEIESQIVRTLRDGVIDAKEHSDLLAYFGSLSGAGPARDKLAGELPQTISGICAVDPQIDFENRTFVHTGICARMKRRELMAPAIERGAVWSKALSGKTHYLIVSDNGNPAWAFSAYGRKVEKAMTLRQQGAPIVIVHEVDYFDAVAD